MSFLLTKLATQFVSPLNLSLLLAVIAGILCWRQWRKLACALLCFALAWLWLWSAPAFVDGAGAAMEGRFPQDTM